MQVNLPAIYVTSNILLMPVPTNLVLMNPRNQPLQTNLEEF